MRFLGLLALVLVVLVSAGSAVGGPPGRWTRVTDTGLRNIDQVALARGVDGVLNAVWPVQRGQQWDYHAARIAAGGSTLGAAKTVLSGWQALNNPALVVEPGGTLRLFFAGLGPAGFDGRVTSATAPPNGSSWTLSGQPHTDAISINEYSASLGAAVKKDGTPVVSWGSKVKVGLEPGPDMNLMEGGCCTYDSDVAVDAATGQVAVVWYSNISRQHGTIARVVQPALGPLLYVPGSATADRSSSLDNGQRVAVTGRIGAPGIYVGYPSGYPTAQAVNVWRVGSAKPVVVSRTGGRRVVVSPAPGGRIWVAWQGADGRIFATRSNPQATAFGAVVSISPPPGTSDLWKLAGEGSAGPLDVVANVTTRNSIAGWHTQLQPGLTLRVAGSIFTVTDAGVPVPSAKVTVGGKTATTDAAGKATIDLPKGTYTARATKPGYVPATLRVTRR